MIPEFITDALKVLLWVAIALVCIWIGFWIANGVVLLSTLLPDFAGAILNLMIDSPSWGWRALGYSTLGLEWLYPVVYAGVIMMLGNGGFGPLWRKEWIAFALITVLVCLIYDPRFAVIMPSCISGVLEFFSTKCNAYLVTYFPHDTPDGVFYTIFDIFMIIACYIGCSIANYNRDHDIY